MLISTAYRTIQNNTTTAQNSYLFSFHTIHLKQLIAVCFIMSKRAGKAAIHSHSLSADHYHLLIHQSSNISPLSPSLASPLSGFPFFPYLILDYLIA